MIFTVDQGVFGYQSKNILQNINFSVVPGKVLAVLGPNGVGKTTLLRASMGFLKWRSGQTLIDGRPIEQMRYQEIWKKIAYVPQAKDSVFSYTVEEMVLFGRCPYVGTFRQPRKADLAVVTQSLASVGISYLKEKRISEISGGELQMVLIARALASEPQLLILDEPESNLDFKNQLIILDIIKELAAAKGIGCIFNTHYPGHALKIADQALLLDRTGTTISGAVGEVITPAHMQQAFGVTVDIHEFTVAEQKYQSVTALSLCEQRK